MTARPTDIARDCSPFLDGLIARHPGWFTELGDKDRLEKPIGPATDELDSCITSLGLDAGLRVFRNREMMRIVWRELNRRASLEETMADLSTLAELCLRAATRAHHDELSRKLGTPTGHQGRPQELVVISMGKLGGHELNLSSDIDVVFSFPEAGHCDGSRKLSNEQFFLRLARRVVLSLSKITENGFCFRVDTRLRPFGESGPLVCSFGAMEQYYQREGRDWERYALVKARPVAGNLDAGAGLISRLCPFVYRRYIDFGAVEALHEMYASLREDSARYDRAMDIKRGPGGIREIEFLVQAFQLLRGGREPVLQTPSLLQALAAIEQLSILPREAVESLSSGYKFLRKLENAIQALHDQQTHTLPNGEDLHRVTRSMGFNQSNMLLQALEETRNSISDCIKSSFPELAPGAGEPPSFGQWKAIRAGAWQTDSALGEPMKNFMATLSRLSLSNRAAQRLDRFMPGLLAQIEAGEFPADVLSDVLDLVLAICRRSAYLSLLVQNPPALKRMLSLFGASDWIAAIVIRYPALLDELIDPALGKLLPDRGEMDATAQRILESHHDAESCLHALNHMKMSFSLRIAVAELEMTLSARQVQQCLTSLAEAIMECCATLAQKEVRTKHGNLPGEGVTIIGYGSLGAAELSYDSDLDLIFLYASGEALSDGARPLATEQYQTAVVRRLLGLLTATTSSGRLYEVDTRLRPNGRSGLLVSTITAFERYQKKDAWTWELQALSRARPCTGSAEIGRAFRRIRTQVLGLARDGVHLRTQVQKMRQRLRQAHSSSDPYKHNEGGLIDIDFIAQLGVLVLGASEPRILEATGTLEQLQNLAEGRWLTAAQFQTLSATLVSLAHARHLALLSRSPPEPIPVDERCREICRSYLTTAQDPGKKK